MEKFKKGDQVYTIEDGLLLPCEIIKVAPEDQIKSFKSPEVSRKKIFKVAATDPSTGEFIVDRNKKGINWYPEKFAYIKFENGKEKWKPIDCIKRSPSEFINFIN